MTSCGFCSQPIETYFDESIQKPIVLVGECGHLFHSIAPSHEKTCYQQVNEISNDQGGSTFLACVHCRTDRSQPELHARHVARRSAEHAGRGGPWGYAPRRPPPRPRNHWERPALDEEEVARREVVQSMRNAQRQKREDGEIEPAPKRKRSGSSRDASDDDEDSE